MPLTLFSGFLAIAALFLMFCYRERVLHPAFWTNAGFVGYAVGGIYYGVAGVRNATFLNLAGIENGREAWFLLAVGVASAGLVSCNLGFFIGDRLAKRSDPRRITFASNISGSSVLLAKIGALMFIAVGMGYYIYFSEHVAGGILQMVQKVAAYRYLAADAGLSALPFHLIYGGALLWLLAWLSGRRQRWVGLLFLPLGMLVILSTGRIALANAFAFSAILAFIYVIKQRVDWRVFVAALITLMPINIVYYFWRQYTSYAYIGREDEFALLQPIAAGSGEQYVMGAQDPITTMIAPYSEKLGYIFRALIGGGNVPDLQQIILIVKGVMDGRLHLMYGSSYLDWARNLATSRVGTESGPPQSVGYRILDAYFPEKIGGPTPGMIGEAVINFWFFAPAALVAFTAGMSLVYSSVVRSNNMFIVLVYCIFLIGTWSLFIKVDSSLIKGLFWSAGPITLAWLSVVAVDRVCHRKRYISP